MSSCSLPGNASFIYTRLRDQKITKYLMQQKKYTYTVNSLKSISVLNLSLFAVYTFYRKNLRVFGFISFATGKTFLRYICPMFIIKHPMFSYTLFVSFSSKMEVATLLSASLDHGVWNQQNRFFYPCIFVFLARMCEMQVQAMTVCSHLLLHLHLNVLMLFTSVFSCSCICV